MHRHAKTRENFFCLDAQLGSHLNGSVQQSMTLSSIVLFVFCLMYDSGQAGVEEPTIFSKSLHTAGLM